MANFKKYALFALALLMQISLFAQSTNAGASSGLDGLMRSEQKIYVVMAVVTTILAGLILYVVRLDRKITKLEKGEGI